MTLEKIPALRAEFWENVNVLGSEGSFNQNLERAGRVAAFVSRRRQIKIELLRFYKSVKMYYRFHCVA